MHNLDINLMQCMLQCTAGERMCVRVWNAFSPSLLFSHGHELSCMFDPTPEGHRPRSHRAWSTELQTDWQSLVRGYTFMITFCTWSID